MNIPQEPDRGGAEGSTLSLMMNSSHRAIDLAAMGTRGNPSLTPHLYLFENNKCPCFRGLNGYSQTQQACQMV